MSSNMKPLLVSLFAVVIGYEKGLTEDARSILKSRDVTAWFDTIPGLEEAVRRSLIGGVQVDYGALSDGLKGFLSDYRKDASSSMALAAVLQAFMQWFRNGSASARSKIEKASASTIFPQWVTQGFVSGVEADQGSVSSKLQKLVKKMAGYAEPGFTSTDDAKAAKEKFPELYQQYLALRREYNSAWKQAVSDTVRSSGAQTLPMSAVEKALQKKGITHGMPLGFTGKIDAIGRWYDNDDNLLTGVPSAAMFPTVRMNSSGEGEWVAQAVRSDGSGAGYIFRQKDQLRNKMQKFERVRDFFPIVDKMRKKWLALIKTFDESRPETVAAIVLELVFMFSARVGTGRGNTGGETTFGISTLQVKHLSRTQRGFILKYKGKDAVATKHIFNAESVVDKLIIAAVDQLLEGKKPTDPLFSYTLQNGNRRPINSAIVNHLFRMLGAPQGVTVRNLRTYHGSRIFKEEVEKLYAKKASMKDGKEATGFIENIAMKVGKALNHVRRTADGVENVTPATALANYIDVSLQVDFYQHYGLPIPPRLEKMTSVEASVSEDQAATDRTYLSQSFVNEVLQRGGVAASFE